MALIKYAAIVSEARGKESGIIFSRNKYGAYIKAKISPVNPQSVYQQNERIALGSFSQQWSGLSEAQKDAWSALGQQVVRVNRFGDQTNYSGFNLFVKCNRNLSTIGQTPIEDSPAVPAVPALGLTTLTLEETGGVLSEVSLAFTATGGDASTNFALIVEATPRILTGRRFLKNFYRLVTTAPAETSPLDFTTEYVARFGEEIAVGDFISVRARLVDERSGLDGPIQSLGGLVVASA